MIALLEAKAAGLFSRQHIGNNVLAGLVVGVVALPLAMAFAIASGARPEQGIYTAIVAGFLTRLLGGTRVQISGPTGAFIAVLSVITTHHGVAGLQLATLMAGVILLLFGVARHEEQWHRRIHLPRVAAQRGPVHHWHDDVRHQNIDILAIFEDFESLFPIGRRDHLIAVPR